MSRPEHGVGGFVGEGVERERGREREQVMSPYLKQKQWLWERGERAAYQRRGG